MYGYGEYTQSLSQEEILSEVTQEEIFGIFIKTEIILDKGAYYKAPYRDDSNPDCYFEEFDGKLYFVDFADTIKSKNCFSFISRCISSNNIFDTLTFITKSLNLGKGNNSEKKTVNKESDLVEVKKIKKERVISFAPRKFNSKDKKFWSQYEISSQNLIEDKVIPIVAYQSTSRKGEVFTIVEMFNMYAYTDFDGGRVKVYRPYGTKDSKWFTNCTQNDVGGIDHLPMYGDLLIIAKSYKDYRVLKNQGLTVVWFQNEGMLPNPTIIRNLGKRFHKIVVWFDNDRAGIDNCKLVVNYINSMFPGKARMLYLDIDLLEEGIKDPSDLIAKKGREKLIEFIISKNLLSNESTR